MAKREITIVGGGLAGLSLGIQLRQLDVPVTIYEAKGYPRHRVCGEFISGKGSEILGRMGALERAEACGGRWARKATLAAGNRATRILPLPEPALCLSRYRLDALLAVVFEELGGKLAYRRWSSSGKPEPGVVWASGRKAYPKHGSGGRSFWLGLKAHALDVPLEADLELHRVPHGYVGLCRLDEQRVNVCGLFRCRDSIRDMKARWVEYLSGSSGSILERKMRGADWDHDSYKAVAGFALKSQSAREQSLCALGDAQTMIPPFTGNGMAMALEAASIATAPLADYSAGTCDWTDARQRIQQGCDVAFRKRLWWADLIHELLFTPIIGQWIPRLVARSDMLWRWAFDRTR